MTRYKSWLLAFFVLFATASCIRPPYPEQLPLQHIPTVIVIVGLLTIKKLKSLSNTGFTLFLLFMTLHVIGARYIYSYVPYDVWCKSMFGFTLKDALSLTRNDYDRLVHFSYGLLMLYPLRELLLRYSNASATFANYVSVEFIMASSMLYELFEWFIAEILSPQNAEAYNGQQGDPWDSQKDMASALLGALVALVIILIRRKRLQSTPR